MNAVFVHTAGMQEAVANCEDVTLFLSQSLLILTSVHSCLFNNFFISWVRRLVIRLCSDMRWSLRRDLRCVQSISESIFRPHVVWALPQQETSILCKSLQDTVEKVSPLLGSARGFFAKLSRSVGAGSVRWPAQPLQRFATNCMLCFFNVRVWSWPDQKSQKVIKSASCLARGVKQFADVAQPFAKESAKGSYSWTTYYGLTGSS